VERRSGKYFGTGTALRQISLATGGTLTLKRSGKLPPNRGIWHQKSQKNFPGVTPPDPLSGRGRPPLAPTPSTATRRARGRKLRRCWDLGLGNRSPKSKFTTRGALSDAAIRPYVRRCVCPLCQRLGQVSRDVRTADPSTHA